MSKQDIRVGHSVWVYAKIFDSDREVEKWSERNFGARGGNTMLLGKVKEMISSTDFVVYFPYDSTEMEVGKKHIHVLTDSYEIWQRHFVRKIPKGQRSRAEAAVSSGTDSGSDDEIEQEEGEEQEEMDSSNPITSASNVLPWVFEPILEDPRSVMYPSIKPKLRCGELQYNDSSVDTSLIWILFTKYFPIAFAEECIIPQTNLAAELDDEWTSPLTIGEFLTFLGAICFMICYPLGGSRRRYWHWMGDEIFPAANLGRFIQWRRFELICKYLSLGNNGLPNDKLRYWREWLLAVKTCFQCALIPGRNIILDESMIRNKNFKAADCVIYIRRKPEPWGHELWTVVDKESGICTNFELNEGKEITRQLKYFAEFGATTATTLRLLEPYFESHRLVFIDSWFQSVKTATELKRRGLDSLGVVKTAHKNYPREDLEARCMNEAGAVASAHVNILDDNVVLHAVQWRSSSHHKLTLLSTASSSAPAGTPYIRPCGKEIPRPDIVELWYDSYGAVDAFNHCKVGGGKNGWEHHLKVQERPNLPLFSGMMSLIDANIYRSMAYFFPQAHSKTTHVEMRQMLVKALLMNPLTVVLPEKRTFSQSTEHRPAFFGHDKRKRCVMCSRKGLERETSLSDMYCTYCGVDAGTFCRHSSGRKCWEEHINNGIPSRKRRK